MGAIFISYRRQDSGPYAGRLRDALSNHFGADQVFRDIDRINPGERFPEVIERAVGSCDALLAVIGPRWLSIKDKNRRRRLDDAEDYVRREIAAALRRDDVLVIPVLIGSVPMPDREDLPEELAALAEHNALRISDEGWDDQVARLIRALEPVMQRVPPTPADGPVSAPPRPHGPPPAPPSPPWSQPSVPQGTVGAEARVGRPLPTFTTGFVGRQSELALARSLLANTSILTITGVGGVGKTRFAVELAKLVTPEHRDGARYAELASVREGGVVGQVVASAVGLSEVTGRSVLDSLADGLSQRQLLLVVDNCEHLVDAARQLVERLAGCCPGLRILATSRQPLGAEGETVWQLPPLPVPDDVGAPVDDLLQVDSVRLFVDRAAKSGSDFVLGTANAAAVAEICRRLEGIPLAIQLVVASLRTLSVEELSTRLREWLLGGRSGAVGQPSRQKTMYAAIDWSYQLLDEGEKAVFARLAVFAGGCTLEAAEETCGSGQEAGGVLDLLTRLVDRSLVVANRREGISRFRLLEPVREYALERMVESGEDQELRASHARWFASVAARAETGIKGAEMLRWLATLDRDEDNIREALRFLLSQGDPVAGLRLASDMEAYWFYRGRFSEGRAWFEEALTKAGDAPPAERATALIRFANLVRSGDHPTALRSVNEGLSLARATGDPSLTARALLELAQVSSGLMRVEEARRHFEECIAQSRQAGDTGLEAIALSGLGDMLVATGDIEAAIATQVQVVSAVQEAGDPWETACAIALLGHWRTLAEDFDSGLQLLGEALARFRAMSSPWGEGWALCAIAEPAVPRGDLATAESSYREALDILAHHGIDELAAWALSGLGHVALVRGDLVAARAHFHDMFLRRNRVYGPSDAPSNYVPHLAALFAAEGRHELAARLLAGAATARARHLFPALYLKDRLADDRAIDTVRRALGEEGFARAWQEGSTTPMEVLVGEVREALNPVGAL